MYVFTEEINKIALSSVDDERMMMMMMMMMMMNCFCGMVDRRKAEPYFQLGPLSEILTIANLRHAASRIWACAEPEFRFSWMKLCSSDNHYTRAPLSNQWIDLIETYAYRTSKDLVYKKEKIKCNHILKQYTNV